ncbi:MAG: carboxypeptidase regulatory-like domain-containing protein [Bacteroidales bacterium]
MKKIVGITGNIPSIRGLWMLLCMLCSIGTAFPQGTNATIAGVVTDMNNETVIGAHVQVRNESTGFQAATVTSEKGEYQFRQLPLGSPYTVSVSYMGYANQAKKNYVLNQGNVLTVNFKMEESSVEMTAVTVEANSLKKSVASLGASTAIRSENLQTLPVNGRNFTSLTDLSPLSSGSNLAGQLYSSTSYTIDGMNAKSPLSSGTTNRGPFLVSMEAIREFEVSTNDYDVSQGRAGGGVISSVTKSGTNKLTGSAFFYNRADQLSSPYDVKGNKRSDEYSISQYGLTLGGPIVKDKAHFFLVWDHQTDARPLLIADIQNQDDEITYGISKANLDEFVKIARDQYGVASSQQTGSFDKVRQTNSVFARVDWQFNAANMLTIRNNFNRDVNNQGISDNSKINLYEGYGTHLSQDNSLLASLRSILAPHVTNEAKFQYLYTLDDGKPNEQLPASNIPRAIVENITSTIGEKSYTLNSIQLGGQRYLPETFKNNVFQLVDNLYLATEKANYTFGGDVMFTHLNSLATSEMNGRFYYKGLEDFKNNNPYRYAREVPVGDPTVKQGVLSSALYAQAQMKPFVGFELTVGLRGDYTTYFVNPNDNKLLTSELGLKTTNTVAGFQLQPRIQMAWDIQEKGTDIIRVGAGIFGSNMNNYAMVNNLEFDGVRVLSVDINSSVYDLPDANFVQFRQNPNSVPGVELFDQLGLTKVATFNINGPDVKIPVVYKANASYNHFFSDRLRAGVSLYASLGRNNYMYIDRNMQDQPYFTLSNEDNRGVYVPASTINTAKGTTNWTQGKKSDKIGRVIELVSDGKVNTYTAVVDATYRYYKEGQVVLSYTWNDSRDNTSYNGNVANSATLYKMVYDDPRDLNTVSYSDNQYRSKVVFYGSSPKFWGITAGVRYSGRGGTRYSMVTNGNINGDFVNGNDLAFVFDPNAPSTPQAIKDGINGLLSNPDVDQSFKDYLKASFGKVAERNGGKNGFYGSWDLRLAKDIKTYKTQRLTVSVDLFNLANMIDKTKGLSRNLGKQTLLNVTGFDATTQNYTYSVNNAAGKVTYSGTPWQIQLGAKYTF